MLMFQPFKKYFEISGRARRAEFWLFVLFLVLGGFILTVIDIFLGTYNYDSKIGLLSGLFSLFTIIPSITVGVRRLHDTDRSGYWVLAPIASFAVAVAVLGVGVGSGLEAGSGLEEVFLVFVSLVVLILILNLILLVFYCLGGTKGENRYGPDPKSR